MPLAVRVERDSQPPSARSVVRRHQSSASMVLGADDPDAPDVHLASLRSYEGGEDDRQQGTSPQLTRTRTHQPQQQHPAGEWHSPCIASCETLEKPARKVLADQAEFILNTARCESHTLRPPELSPSAIYWHILETARCIQGGCCSGSQRVAHEPARPASAGQPAAAPSPTNLSVRIRARPQQQLLQTQRTGSAPLAASPSAGDIALPDGYAEAAAEAGVYDDGDVDDADDAYDDCDDVRPLPAASSAERAQRASPCNSELSAAPRSVGWTKVSAASVPACPQRENPPSFIDSLTLGTVHPMLTRHDWTRFQADPGCWC